MSEILNTIWSEDINEFTRIIKSQDDADSIIDESLGNSVLIACCAFNLPDFVKYLISKKPNYDFANKDGNTSLHISSYSSDLSIVEEIIKRSRHLINNKNHIGQTPIMLAAKRCHPDVVRLLLDGGAHTNAQDHLLNTALHWCVTEKHHFDDVLKCIDYLDPERKEMYIKNSSGKTAIDYMLTMQDRWPEYVFPSTFPLINNKI